MNENDQIKLSKIKVYRPKAFLIDFHGTICPIKWEEEVILPFVINNLNDYLIDNWSIIDLMNLIDTLRQESFVQRFQFNREDAPLIEEFENENDNELIRKSVCDFIRWQIMNRKESQTSIQLQRLVWKKGMQEQKLKTIIFDDVLDAFKRWKNEKIKIYLLSSVAKDEIYQFMKYSSLGDLTVYIDDYFDNSIGKRIDKQTFIEIGKQIQLQMNDLIFITDSGKEAKTAVQAGTESIIILRPKNHKLREYYLTCFQSITSFDEIELVNRI